MNRINFTAALTIAVNQFYPELLNGGTMERDDFMAMLGNAIEEALAMLGEDSTPENMELAYELADAILPFHQE